MFEARALSFSVCLQEFALRHQNPIKNMWTSCPTAPSNCRRFLRENSGAVPALFHHFPVEIPHICASLRKLQSETEEHNAAVMGTSASQMRHDFSRIPVHLPAAKAIQTKLAVSERGDAYEQEADRVADQVLAATAHFAVSITPPPLIQRLISLGQMSKLMICLPTS